MDDLQTWRILLIDDDEDDYYLTKAMLAEAHSRKFELVWVSNYEEAFEHILAGTFDAALVDYDLGAHTGIELIKEVVNRGCVIPLILYTGRGSYQVDVEAMQAGATLYLTKREANSLLLERFIRYAIERRQAEETLRESRDRLEQRVAERTQALAQINQELEKRVVERTYEQELANRRLEAVLQTQPVAVWIADASGRIIQTNPMTEMVWGGKVPLSESVEGYKVYRGWWSDTGKELEAAEWGLARALKGETSVGDVIDIARFDGKQGTIINSAAPIYDRDGQFLGAVAVAQDITHQRLLEQQALESADRAEWQAEELRAAIKEKESAERELREQKARLEQTVAILEEERALNEKLAKENFRRVEELDAVFDAISDTVVVYDSAGVPVRVNKAVIEIHGFDMTGHKREELAKHFDLKGPDGRRVPFEDLPSSKAMRGEIIRGEPLYYFDKNHQEVHVQANASPLFGPDQHQIGAVVIWHDVTRLENYAREQHRLMMQNDHQRKVLEHLMEVLPVGVCILRGAEHRLEYANSVFKTLVGDVRDPVYSHNYADIFSKLNDIVDSGSLDTLYKDRDKVITREIKISATDGKEKQYWALTHVPIPGLENEVDGILVLATDLTEQVLIRKHVENERDRFRILLDSLEDEVWFADQNGNIQLVNPSVARNIGYERTEDLIGPSVENIVSKLEVYNSDGNLRTVENAPLIRSLQGETVKGEEIVRNLKTQKLQHRQYVSVPIRDNVNQVTSAVAVVRDITERKQAEAALKRYAEDLRHSNRELEEFAFTASHDLQEPLRKIETFSDLLSKRLGDSLEARDKDYLNRMHNAVVRMRKMIADLLVLARITSQGQPPVQVDLNQTARAVLSDLEILLVKAEAKVEVGELPEIEADPSQMHRLLQNLIENAVKFHRKNVKPVVRIGCNNLSPGLIELFIQDNGIGFKINDFKLALQPFKRLHSKVEYEGSGMGLAICQRIVERHGGAITATSEIGQGSTFTVTLPIRSPTSSLFEGNQFP
jgi:two-component system, LuxR family, sensor kinase FixL